MHLVSFFLDGTRSILICILQYGLPLHPIEIRPKKVQLKRPRA